MDMGYGVRIERWSVVQLIRNRYHPIWMIQKCFPSFIPLIRIIKYLLFFATQTIPNVTLPDSNLWLNTQI